MTTTTLPTIERVAALGICDDCGEVHTRCKAHRSLRRTEGILVACRLAAMRGQLVCKVHGGNSPQARRKAEAVIAEEKAQKALRRVLGKEVATAPVIDAEAELASLAGEIVAWKEAAMALVDRLDNPIVASESGLDVHPSVKLAERAIDRASRVLGDMVRLNLTERRVRVEEAQMVQVATALRSVLSRHGVDVGLVLPELASELRRMDAIEAGGQEA